jgi:hypothetical protein
MMTMQDKTAVLLLCTIHEANNPVVKLSSHIVLAGAAKNARELTAQNPAFLPTTRYTIKVTGGD